MSFYSSNSRPASPPPAPTSQPLPPQKPVPQHATFAARQQKHVPPGVPIPMVVGSHTKTVRSVAWSCNGQSVASGSDDRNVKIWTRRVTGPNAFELAHSEPLLPHPTPLTPKPTTTCANPITNLSFSPRRVDILAVASNDGSAGITGGKVVAVQGPGSISYDKAAEEAWLKEVDDGMKGKGRKVEPPKVEIWNTSKRQIITTIHLAHTPVFLAFHPSAKQLAIVCFDSRERNDYVVFAWQPDAVAAEGDLAFEDSDPATERAKREQEREAYRALLARQQAGEESAQEEGWQVRTDIRLGEKNYRVSEMNGAMFGPCGTRMYAGNHDGRLNGWEYPIKRVVPEESGKEEEKKEEIGEKDEDGDQEDDEDAPMRRSNENRGSAEPMETDKEATAEEDTPMDAEDGAAEDAVPNTEEVKEDSETQQVKEDAETTEEKTVTETKEEKEDTEMAPEQQTGEESQPAIKDEDVQMQDAEQPSQAEDSAKPESDGSADVKVDVPSTDTEDAKPDVPSTDTTDAAVPTTTSQPAETPSASTQVSKAPSPVPVLAPAPEPAAPPAQMLKYLYGQVLNSGCLNCIDIDPRRRYIATGGSEGMVSLCQVGEWIGVASFDSYTEEVKNVKFSWDGEYIAAAGDDRCIDIMSTATGTTLHRIPTRGTVASIAWSPARHTLCFATQGQGSSNEWYYVQM